MSEKLTLGHSEVAFPVWPICQKFNRQYIEFDDKLEQRVNPSPSEFKAYWDLVSERMEAATITIVFAASFLDQFIYKYGCSYFGIEDCERDFDRLSLRAKWLKILARAVGKSIPENSPAIAMLDELVQVRHKIIHYRVFDISSEVVPAFDKTEWLAKLTHKCARNTVTTVKSLMGELGKIDSGQGFQKFLKDFLAK